MTDIHSQLAWEEQMMTHGVERYRAQHDKTVEGGRADETSAGSRLLRSYVLQTSDHIAAYLAGRHPAGRRRNKYAPLLDAIDTDKAAMLALKVVIRNLFEPDTVQKVSLTIGKLVEDEMRFTRFAIEHKEYYDEVVRSWEQKNTQNYRHKHRVLVKKSKDLEMDWIDWGDTVRFSVGSLILSLLMEVTDLVEVYRPKYKGRNEVATLVPTDACRDWVMRHNEVMEVTYPVRMPSLVPPADWISPDDGGYFSPALRNLTPLVKYGFRKGHKERRRRIRAAEMPMVLAGANALQRTPWRVNKAVLSVMREVWAKNLGTGMPKSRPYDIPPCPIDKDTKPKDLPEDSEIKTEFDLWRAEAREVHRLEHERIAKNLSCSRTVQMATKMSEYDAFYYVYQADFRGRFYAATTGLSPQGDDIGKALLEFGEEKPLGERGLYWFKVHGANKYGEDKCSYDARVAWIEDRHEQWLAVADDPISNRAVWGDADKPYQFLAWCFEYAQAARDGTEFRSRLPIARDGSCNGLQHFSAMLRDTVGGAAVNLTPGDKPADIYQDVADVCTRKLVGLRSLNDPMHNGAVNWMELFTQDGGTGMPRSLAKPPVMTLPYGSTRQTCTETTFRWIMKEAPDFFEKKRTFSHAIYITPIIWDSISEVVVAARAAMGWVQKAASVLAKDNQPFVYTTPLGFPVYQANYKYESRQIETQIGGRLRLSLASDTDTMDVAGQRQGSSPNFVHSIDATHMVMCINAGVDEGITSFAMIHDDFGVHACDIDKWDRIIREQFVKLYTEQDVLADLKTQLEQSADVELPELPEKGDLEITDVLESPYFFG